MRRIPLFAMVLLSLSMGFQYALSGQWWGLLACIMAGLLWAYPSPYRADQRSTLSLSIFAGIGALGIFFGQSQLWSLTNFVLLLIVWDIDHYTRVFREFEADQTSQKTSSAHFYAHLKPLGIIAGLGWCISMVALNIRIQINFTVALILILLMIFGLRQVARYVVTIEK